MYETLHGVKKGIKDIVAPQGLFEDLGLKYLGPVDGHDEQAIEAALRKARAFGGPVLVHVLTQKGRGYDPAITDEADQFHAVGVINPETGLPLEIAGRSWTDEFSDEMVRIGEDRPDVVAITAAMMIPVGLKSFGDRFPDRTFDVGIAEQHALTMAAGLAFTGLHPVVAVYATFLNRAFDQLLMDCAMHRAGVTVVLDRSGITGPDGASHHGMWDMTISGVVPGLHLAAPRDGQQVARAVRAAVDIADAPSVVRFPKGSVADPVVAVRTSGTVDVLAEPDGDDVDLLLVGIGSMAVTALAAADKLTAEGVRVRVVDPVWALPVSDDLVALAGSAGRVAVVEDNVVVGGIGSPGRARPARGRPHHAARPARHPQGVPRPRFARPGARPGRAHAGCRRRSPPRPAGLTRRSGQLVDRGHRHEPPGCLGEPVVERDERVGLQPGECDVLGVEGVGPVELVGHVPRHALQHAVAEQPQLQPPHVADGVLGLLLGELAVANRLVEQRQHLGAQQRGGEQLVLLTDDGLVPRERDRDVGSDDVPAHGAPWWCRSRLPPPYGTGRHRRGTRQTLRQTDTWLALSEVNSAPSQPATRRSSSRPASSAIRSHSAGHT